MHSIIFDLETSDRETVGQILNYAFLLVDEEWQVKRELCGTVRLSRLQIPSSGAILANRVNVLELQKTAQQSEREAARAIAIFMEEVIAEARAPVAFIGYNSFRFDVPYLRTTLIRNGINPYFGAGNLVYRDLFAAARKLAATNHKFPRVEGEAQADGKKKLSLRLESLARALKLLKGKQTHESRSDALLTVALAQCLHSEFGFDVRRQDTYEGLKFHGAGKPRVLTMLDPNYDLSISEIAERTPVTLLNFDRRYALWINLKRFAAGEGRRSVMFFKNQGSSMILDPDWQAEAHFEEVAVRAHAEFKELTVSNFFKRSTCDIEQDIFRVDFDGIGALHAAIWEGQREAVKELANRDVTALYVRNVIANHTWGSPSDESVEKKLREYADYRYGGSMVLSKVAEPDDGTAPRRHPTLREMLTELNKALIVANDDDRRLLEALLAYTKSSDVVRFCGPNLLADSAA